MQQVVVTLVCHPQACSFGLFDRTLIAVAFELPQVVSLIVCPLSVSSITTGQACACLNKQHCNGCVNQPSSGSMPHVATPLTSPHVESDLVKIIVSHYGGVQSAPDLESIRTSFKSIWRV